jgi:Holliday junction resolvasome RuvABC endonuclease subunit
MNHSPTDQKRVLAIDPTHRGFGYAILEGPERLIEWGVVQVRESKDSQCLKRIQQLIERYAPEVIVVEDCTGKGCRRGARVHRLIEDVRQVTGRKRVPTRHFPRSMIRRAFEHLGAVTKSQIAAAIAKLFAELAPHLPPVRKIWKSEDERSAIFDAMSLALTLFHHLQRRNVGQHGSSPP